ncbi:extensin family protein [Sphingosinithalassobacter tenebrarum]|uniref:Extensin family protein n=1 Tax=Stakelama tenebrarum TaxID=2711215 RepID=A0A6G6YAS0_9SPHN|nr:extensin family protein [Sphingosinithalassobacter tenebrarum]
MGALALAGYGWLRERPQDLPWTQLDLADPIGMFTGSKLAGLTDDFDQCRALLDRAGVGYDAADAVSRPDQPQCGYSDGIELSGGDEGLDLSPGGLETACPVAAALMKWKWDVLQPAARRHFDSRVAQVIHLGSYSCRRLYGRESGGWSEHATADAVDISGFRLEDGTRISVLEDWDGEGARAAFLRDVRDGACKLYATVLSPEYNAQHRDHFHFDQAERGASGRRMCG